MLEAPKEVPHTGGYSFIRPPPVTNEMGQHSLEEAAVRRGEERRMWRKLFLLAFSHARMEGLAPGIWLEEAEMTDEVGEVLRASRSRAGGG